MNKSKVVCLGEALIDRIKNKSNQGSTDFLGGAPANVACALSKLKINSAFIGRLGSDEFGEKFIEEFETLAIDTSFLQFDKDLSTRVVKVDRDEFGDRYFSGFDGISSTDFADQALEKNLLTKNLNKLESFLKETKYLVSGTIMLASSISAAAVDFLIRKAQYFNVKVIVDLNWREVFWNYSIYTCQTSSKERVALIRNFLDCADLLKMAKEEAILFFENDNPFEISQKLLKRPDVIITDGSSPISWYINEIQGITEVIDSSEIVDTTGAGDAFLAGFISKLTNSGYPSNQIEIQDYMKFASVCGFLTCLGEGAIEQQPDYGQVIEFLGSHIL